MSKKSRTKGVFSKFRKWTKEEDELLKALYNTKPNAELGKIFNRGSSKVYRRAAKLGLIKDKIIGYKILSQKKKEYHKTHPNSLKGENNGRWLGGIMKRRRGYMHIKVYDHPYSSKDNYVLLHRYIVEQFIGRHLKREEVIHHINFDKHDNRLENLYIFKTNAAHISYHSKYRYGKIGYLTSNLKDYVQKQW